MPTKVSGKRVLRRWLLVCLAIGVAVAVAVAAGALAFWSPSAEARHDRVPVAVDARTELGELNNPVWYQNQVRVLPRGDLALARQAGPTKVIRVWLKPATYYNQAANTYDFTGFYPQLDNAASHTTALMANLDQCPQELMVLDAPEPCRAVLKAGIKHYKQKYPALRYLELFNEPDRNWAGAAGDPPALPVEVYYRWFKIAYSVVNEVNAELRPKQPLLIGGPVTYRLNEDYLPAFLDRYASDPDPAKRLDFISYHEYTKRSNPAEVRDAKPTVAGWLRDRGLDPQIPVCVSEYGVFPGDASGAPGRGTTYADDLLTQAAAMATLGNYYLQGGMDMPMHWIYNHSSNERKSMFVDEVDGAAQPYYNLVRMQSLLKRTRVNSSSGRVSATGIGVNALATKDETGIAVLVTNYQWTEGRDSHQARLVVSHLPAEFTEGGIHLERYLVDAVTSNYAHDPNDSALRKVEDGQLTPRDTVSVPFGLGPNAITLVVLTPVD